MLTLADVAFAADGHTLVEGIDLEVAAGRLTVVVGPSGVGKTTVLRLALGLERPTVGRVTNGFLRMTAVFQEPRLLAWASAVDNVALALAERRLGRAERRARARARLLRFGFTDADLGKHPRRLSGGMRARVAIARALVAEPDLVVMDEPFAALDPTLRREIGTALRDLVATRGVAVLFVTHDLAEAVRLADEVVVMAGSPGRITARLANRPAADLAAAWAAAADLARRPEIAAAFEGPVRRSAPVR